LDCVDLSSKGRKECYLERKTSREGEGRFLGGRWLSHPIHGVKKLDLTSEEKEDFEYVGTFTGKRVKWFTIFPFSKYLVSTICSSANSSMS